MEGFSQSIALLFNQHRLKIGSPLSTILRFPILLNKLHLELGMVGSKVVLKVTCHKAISVLLELRLMRHLATPLDHILIKIRRIKGSKSPTCKQHAVQFHFSFHGMCYFSYVVFEAFEGLVDVLEGVFLLSWVELVALVDVLGLFSRGLVVFSLINRISSLLILLHPVKLLDLKLKPLSLLLFNNDILMNSRIHCLTIIEEAMPV